YLVARRVRTGGEELVQLLAQSVFLGKERSQPTYVVRDKKGVLPSVAFDVLASVKVVFRPKRIKGLDERTIRIFCTHEARFGVKEMFISRSSAHKRFVIGLFSEFFGHLGDTVVIKGVL